MDKLCQKSPPESNGEFFVKTHEHQLIVWLYNNYAIHNAYFEFKSSIKGLPITAPRIFPSILCPVHRPTSGHTSGLLQYSCDGRVPGLVLIFRLILEVLL